MVVWIPVPLAAVLQETLRLATCPTHSLGKKLGYLVVEDQLQPVITKSVIPLPSPCCASVFSTPNSMSVISHSLGIGVWFLSIQKESATASLDRTFQKRALLWTQITSALLSPTSLQ